MHCCVFSSVQTHFKMILKYNQIWPKFMPWPSASCMMGSLYTFYQAQHPPLQTLLLCIFFFFYIRPSLFYPRLFSYSFPCSKALAFPCRLFFLNQVLEMPSLMTKYKAHAHTHYHSDSDRCQSNNDTGMNEEGTSCVCVCVCVCVIFHLPPLLLGKLHEKALHCGLLYHQYSEQCWHMAETH